MTRRRVAPLALVALLAGCQTWQTVTVRPGVAPFDRTSEAHLTLTDGTTSTLTAARVIADTIVGTSPTTGLVHRTPVTTVRSIELRRHSKTRTTSLLVAHASAVIMVITLIVQVQPHYRGAF